MNPERKNSASKIDFCQRLKTIRITYLLESLFETVKNSNLEEIDKQLHEYVPEDSLAILAKRGLRGEIFFPLPCLLEKNPRLLSYYRLLSGFSQGDFASYIEAGYRFSAMNSLDRQGDPDKQSNFFKECCSNLSLTNSMLLRAIEVSGFSETIFRELISLVMNSQIRKGKCNLFDKYAVNTVFGILKEILRDHILEEKERVLVLRGDIKILKTEDPDIGIMEQLRPGKYKYIAALKVNGSTDISSAREYLREIERSHRKAKSKGYREFWSLIGFDINYSVAKQENPITQRFYYIPDLLLKDISQDYKNFREHLLKVTNLKDYY